jgi:crotonobetainyl-CoA:carnitine CoA-transferase CaiB-like acyl-CoA transferase
VTGLPWLNGDADPAPVAFGPTIADLFAGAHLLEGILACLVRRGIIGKGGKVEVSLMESVLNFRFEVITTHLNDGRQLPSGAR